MASEDQQGRSIGTVIAASALGTMFEWYDFFIYGTLAASGIIGRAFFPTGSPIVQTLLAWAGFAVGFGCRPLGAALFGYLGDRFGRKATFLLTITLMGLATACVGIVPDYASIGFVAPVLVVGLRVLQGLALGGEYGGAAIYVAESAPPGRAGFYTSFIQAGVAGGFILSILVVLATKAAIGIPAWGSWGWRLPFLISIALLLISIWIRAKLSESPVYERMRSQGQVSRNPFIESFTHPGNLRRLFVALFGISAGLTVIFYTALFSVLSFLVGTMHVAETAAQLIVGVCAAINAGWFVFFGWVSDKVGRKTPIVIGYALTLILLFPIFWVMGSAANPGLSRAARAAPVVVSGPTCRYDPFAAKQADACGQLLDYLSKRGIPYQKTRTPAVAVAIDGRPIADHSPAALDAALASAGYPINNGVPSASNIVVLGLAILALGALSGITYGPVAALLAEIFPPKIRYSSMSIPYHIGTGYFGGFLPLISQYMVARSGNPYAGLWYTWWVVMLALLVTLALLHEDRMGRTRVTTPAD